jgi:hypothetical protein
MNTKSEDWWLDRVGLEASVVERADGVYETQVDSSAVRIEGG